MSTWSQDKHFDGLIPVVEENELTHLESKHYSKISRSPSSASPEVYTRNQKFYSAPEIVDNPYKFPQTYHPDDSDLELNRHAEKSGYAVKEYQQLPNNQTFEKKRSIRRLPLLLLILAAVVIIGLAVGLGVGLTRHNSDQSQDSTSDTIILDDTSLSATISSEGNRHVFYQSAQGDILHAQYEVDNDDWLHNNLTMIMSSKPARTNSPLASVLLAGLSGGASSSGNMNQSIILLYVDNTDSLTALSYQPGGHISQNLFNTILPVKKDSRAVKMTPLPVASNFTGEVILTYESADNGFRVLHGYYYVNMSIATGNSGYQPVWQYEDITDSILNVQYVLNKNANATLPSTTTIFDCSFIAGYPQPGLLLGYLGLNTSSQSGSTKLPALAVGEFRQWDNGVYPQSIALDFDTTITSSNTLPGLGFGDTALLTWKTGGVAINSTYSTEPVWINENKLYNFSPTLGVDFPYSRFGWTASNSSNALFIYNQANGTAFVESQFVEGIQWESNYIFPTL